MKTKKSIYILTLAGVLCLALSSASCKKKKAEDTPTPAAPANGTLMLHFHTNVDTNEVDTYNQVYVMTGGRKISVNVAQLYVSGIQLVKTDGSTYDVSGVNILKLMEVEEYMAGSVPSGNYKSIRFNVGLSAATNSTTPAANDSTLNRANMWFGTTAQPSGYVFLNFQGKIDTSAAANNSVAQMQPFKYRIGTNAHLKNISMPDQNYTVTPNQVQFVHIVIDYNKLLTGVTLNVNSNLTINTTADNALPLATQITNNIPLMFSYEY
ncbi:MAG: MbnP family protein [Bacteroidia bacterium]